MSAIEKFKACLYMGVFLFLVSALLFLYSLLFAMFLSMIDVAFIMLITGIILIIMAAHYSNNFDAYSLNKVKEDILNNKIIMAILSIMATLFVVPFIFVI